MKPIVLLLSTTIMLSSCTEFQYLTVSGENIIKNDKHEFVSENDTLKVQYHFNGYRGKVGISIYNKSGQPLEVDWKKSALIVDGKAYSYFNPNLAIGATIQRDTLSQQQRFARLGDPVYLASINGSVFIDQPTEFIPQASFIYKEPLVLPLSQIQNLPEAKAEKANLNLAQTVVVPYKKIHFAQDSSPVRFRSYLTLRIGNNAAQKEFTIEHNFYISEVWKTSSAPDDFPAEAIKRGDRFYLQP